MVSVNIRNALANPVAAVLLLAMLVPACSPAQIRKDIVIDRVIQEARTRSQQALRENPGVFARIDVRREGDDTIVFEYLLKPEAEWRVAELSNSFRNPPRANEQDRKDLQFIANEGISARILFKNAAGDVLDDFRLTADDL